MNQLPRVAIVADDRRHDAVAQALHLLGDTWPRVPATGAVIKPNLVSQSDLRASSHPNTVATVADFLYSRGAEHLTLAEGATDASHPNDLGFMRQAEAFEPVIRKALSVAPPVKVRRPGK